MGSENLLWTLFYYSTKQWREHKPFKWKKSMKSFRMQNLDVINCIEKINSSNEESE
jgi:hypothetical protein